MYIKHKQNLFTKILHCTIVLIDLVVSGDESSTELTRVDEGMSSFKIMDV